MNTFKVGLLLAGMTGLFLAVGYLVGGPGGMLIAFGVAVAMNAWAYWNSDKAVLRMYGAQPVDQNTAPDFYALVARLAQRAGLPMPAVYIIDSEQPNAFATGRDPEHAAVAASRGLLSMLSEREVAAVMAHELTHVKNRDTLVMTVTATIAGAIGMLANFAMFAGGHRDENRGGIGIIGSIMVMILAPLAATLVQLAISRSREYGADEGGAAISDDPMALASALEKIEHYAHQVPNYDAQANPATAHLFIINPLAGTGTDNLFATHPSTANRIARLRELAAGPGAARDAVAYQAAPRRAARIPDTAPPRRTGPWG